MTFIHEKCKKIKQIKHLPEKYFKEKFGDVLIFKIVGTSQAIFKSSNIQQYEPDFKHNA